MSFVFRFVRSRIMILCFIISGIRSCFFKLVEIHRLFLNNQISVQAEKSGEGGIRTLGGLPHTDFRDPHLKPLGHLSSKQKYFSTIKIEI